MMKKRMLTQLPLERFHRTSNPALRKKRLFLLSKCKVPRDQKVYFRTRYMSLEYEKSCLNTSHYQVFGHETQSVEINLKPGDGIRAEIGNKQLI